MIVYKEFEMAKLRGILIIISKESLIVVNKESFDQY